MALKLAVLASLFFGDAVLSDESDTQLARIRLHEERFSHCQVNYSFQPFDKKPDEQLKPAGPMGESTYYVSGNKQRQDSTATEPRTGVVETQMAVTDGERMTVWMITNTDSAGQATVMPVDPAADATFPLAKMRPLEWHRPGKGTGYSVNVDSGAVRVKWEERNTHVYELECREYSGDLCPVAFRSIWRHPGKTDEVGLEILYTYDESGVSDGHPYPVKIELLAPGHGIYDVYTIRAVDFSPDIPDSLFTLEFKDGTWVTDRATGISRKYYRSAVSPGSLERALDEQLSAPRNVEYSEGNQRVPAREADLARAVSFLENERAEGQAAVPAGVWIALILGVAGLGAGVWGVKRRRRKRQCTEASVAGHK